MRPDRVVIGADDDEATAILKSLYRPLYLIETPVVLTSVVTAELTKYAANAFLATKVSFINEFANLCEVVGADVHDIARGIGIDRRIGPKFLHPGPGFGGSCFPKDTRSVAHFARERESPLQIVEAVVAVNEAQQRRMLEKVSALLDGDVAGREIGVLGLSFKPETDDMRDAPAVPIIRGLLERRARVRLRSPGDVERAQAAARSGPLRGRVRRVRGRRRARGTDRVEPVPDARSRAREVVDAPAARRGPAQHLRPRDHARRGILLRRRRALASRAKFRG
jgi:UDPglucose 6-dehydrogenase